MRVLGPLLCAVLFSGWAAGQTLNCNLEDYKPLEGLTATVRERVLEVKWRGERDQQLRAEFAIQNGQPVVRELAASINGAKWLFWAKVSRRSFRLPAECAAWLWRKPKHCGACMAR